jgi:hypothetical protein
LIESIGTKRLSEIMVHETIEGTSRQTNPTGSWTPKP